MLIHENYQSVSQTIHIEHIKASSIVKETLLISTWVSLHKPIHTYPVDHPDQIEAYAPLPP